MCPEIIKCQETLQNLYIYISVIGSIICRQYILCPEITKFLFVRLWIKFFESRKLCLICFRVFFSVQGSLFHEVGKESKSKQHHDPAAGMYTCRVIASICWACVVREAGCTQSRNRMALLCYISGFVGTSSLYRCQISHCKNRFMAVSHIAGAFLQVAIRHRRFSTVLPG